MRHWRGGSIHPIYPSIHPSIPPIHPSITSIHPSIHPIQATSHWRQAKQQQNDVKTSSPKEQQGKHWEVSTEQIPHYSLG